MVAVGEMAPDFDAPSSLGGTLKLSSLRGSPVVLYFYPAADTPGCTRESKGFRDLHGALAGRGVKVVGVSTDELDAQCKFSEKYGFPFPLVADPGRSIARSYGVLNPSGKARRVTFYLRPDGAIAEVLDSSDANAHVEKAKALYLASA